MSVYCGSHLCYEDSEYCCMDDDGNMDCCTTYYYYQSWWFWFMWIMFLMIILSCSVACYRSCRRRRHVQYIVVGQTEQPVYGTLAGSALPANPYVVHPTPSAPVAPPAYAQKPPAYTPTPTQP